MAFAAEDWLLGTRSGGTVERRLRKLGRDWHVLHDLVHPAEGVKIEHLVIGSPGVFIVSSYWLDEPAHQRGRDRLKSTSNLLSVSAHAARAVSRRLTRVCGEDVTAWSLIVFNGLTLDVRKENGDVYVVAEQLLVPWLKSLVPTISASSVESIYAHAASPTTWRPHPYHA